MQIPAAPEAQESFERGVALLHSFAFAAGEKAFREALDRDPACAIATWGIATILIGNTFALGPSPENAERAVAAIERGRAIGAKSQRERDYIEAIAAFYDRFLERPQAARMRSLSDAFEALAARYKDDDETQIFSALYLTASQPLGDKTYARALKAAAILDAQFAKHPDHPGVAHYLIHAYDFPPIAQKGLPAALCYADIAPGAVACAAYALAYFHARRVMEGIGGYQRALGGCGESGEQYRPGAACHGLHGLCGSAIGARR